MRECIICGRPITHHHSYCEQHYPHKTATILTLTKKIAEIRKENAELKTVLANWKKTNPYRSQNIQLRHTIKSLNGTIQKLKGKKWSSERKQSSHSTS